MAINMLDKSILNADYSGAVCMNGCPLLVENEKRRMRLSPWDFCPGLVE